MEFLTLVFSFLQTVPWIGHSAYNLGLQDMGIMDFLLDNRHFHLPHILVSHPNAGFYCYLQLIPGQGYYFLSHPLNGSFGKRLILQLMLPIR
jgi:hypothetical protein